jgi:hypothetical protein
MLLSLLKNKKAADFPEPRLFTKTKKPPTLRGPRLSSFYVSSSKTPSSSPRAYEYYEAQYQMHAVRQKRVHKRPSLKK